MASGIVESLSVQELIDCDTKNDQGCVGGNPAFAYPYIVGHGLASEARYPYIVSWLVGWLIDRLVGWLVG